MAKPQAKKAAHPKVRSGTKVKPGGGRDGSTANTNPSTGADATKSLPSGGATGGST